MAAKHAGSCHGQQSDNAQSHRILYVSVHSSCGLRSRMSPWSDMMLCDCSYIADTSGESEDAPVKRGLPLGADSSGNLYFHLGSDLGKLSASNMSRPFRKNCHHCQHHWQISCPCYCTDSIAQSGSHSS